jgi:uncharacterized protein YbcC (UPF0753/DUF2309 family)
MRDLAMNPTAEAWPGPALELFAAAVEAGAHVPPLWPLATSVAVNPYLGQAGEPLPMAAARLARAAGIPVTPPRAGRLAQIEAGAVGEDDLRGAIAATPGAPATVAALLEAAREPAPEPRALPTVAELAAEASGIDWPEIVAERVGFWAAIHFDRGQALWPAPEGGAFASWHAFAKRDLTPEIHGLSGFAAHVAALPVVARPAIAQAGGTLGLDGRSAPTVFHRLHMTLGGWSQLARQRLWEAEMEGGHDRALKDLLAVRLVWEEALYLAHRDRIGACWEEVRAAHAAPLEPTRAQIVDAVLQTAAERAERRRLAPALSGPARAPEARPEVQAAFCIDVRSEVFRRGLEATAPGVRTLGFAGFFGLTLRHRAFASDVEEARAPVLVAPGLGSRATGSAQATRFARRAVRAWGRFKLAAVSSFAFVEGAGPLYVGKLVRDALGLGVAAGQDPAPTLDPMPDLAARTEAAETVLRAMSLTQGFARVVLIAGHGATAANNAHLSGLQCGACGGFSGEVNARLLAALLNDDAVREGLVPRGIAVPRDTIFVAGLHDTTTDAVTLFEDRRSGPHGPDLERLRRHLDAAGALARAERAGRLPRAEAEGQVARRARDWAEVRPEWALAGCKAFVAAPRSRTAGGSLEGRAFLHDYDWRADEGFPVLELILTAPVVVASWISLQYYGSSVAPGAFGAGNKLLHNVVGGVGVVEGNGGLLRAGLPWQSVHDGERLVHEPLRLSVVVEAPRDAVEDVLSRHPGVDALFRNGWLHLSIIEDDALLERGPQGWSPLSRSPGAVPAPT